MLAQKIISINPATLESIGEVAVSSADDVKKAVATARKAQPDWRKLGVRGRVQALKKLYVFLDTHQKECAALETQEMGRPIKESLSGMPWSLNQLRWNLENAEKILAPETTCEDDETIHQVHYEPYGVLGVITPWNFPQSNFIMGALQPLLAGNTVVYKASEEVPFCEQYLARAWRESGLPEGVFTAIYGAGDVGEILAHSDIDFLHFTGSTAVGKKLYQIAAQNFIPVTLELGGSDAGIVFADADLDAAIESVFWAKFINGGQICCGLKRLFVQQNRFDEVVERLKKYIAGKKFGSPAEPDTELGPLAAMRQQKLLAEQVNDAISKGAKIIMGGRVSPRRNGAFYEPTLMTGVNSSMRAYKEELFGPVLPVFSFATEEEVIRLANDTPYGLSAYIFTEDRACFARVAAQLEAGSISHNGADYSHPANPFGGYKGSGLGKTCGKIGLQHACRIKVTSMRKAT